MSSSSEDKSGAFPTLSIGVGGMVGGGITGTENVRQKLLDSRKAMRSLVTGSDYNIEKVRELADQQASLREELTVARIDTMHQTLQVLTAEQQAKVAMLREQRMKGKKAMMDDRQDDWQDNCGDGSLRVWGQDAVNRSRPLRAENVVRHHNRQPE